MRIKPNYPAVEAPNRTPRNRSRLIDTPVGHQPTVRCPSLIASVGAKVSWKYRRLGLDCNTGVSMTIGLKLGNVTDEIGSPDFFHSFFSTIHHHLEDGTWGSGFPVLLNELYQGTLAASSAPMALDELTRVSGELAALPPDQVIWDIDDLMAQPPWGRDVSPDITDLSNYFVTSTGRDLILTIKEALESLIEDGGIIEIV